MGTLFVQMKGTYRWLHSTMKPSAMRLHRVANIWHNALDMYEHVGSVQQGVPLTNSTYLRSRELRSPRENCRCRPLTLSGWLHLSTPPHYSSCISDPSSGPLVSIPSTSAHEMDGSFDVSELVCHVAVLCSVAQPIF